MTQWVFAKLDPAVVRRDPNETQLFKAEQAGDDEYAGTDALVREILQNSIDAATGKGPVRVRLALHPNADMPSRVNGGEKPWRLAGSGGRLNRASPKCSVVDFVIPCKAVIMAGFRVKNPEETSEAGVHRHGNLGGSTPSRFDGRVEQTSGLS